MSLSIQNVRLIDASHTSWKQILVFRENDQNRRKLRRLRQFFFDNFEDKPKTFIEDNLAQRMADYEQAIKDFGFETKLGYLTVLLSSQVVVPATAVTVASALFGLPLATIAAAGVAVELGSFALKIAESKHALAKFQRDHELAYIMEAKKMLVEPKA